MSVIEDIQGIGAEFEEDDLYKAEEILSKNPKIMRRMFRYNQEKMSWMRLAAREGKLEFVKLFHSYGAILEHKALMEAGKYGHFHIVQYFDEQSVGFGSQRWDVVTLRSKVWKHGSGEETCGGFSGRCKLHP